MRKQKLVSVQNACDLTQIFWPDFVEINGCIFVAFQPHSGDSKESYDGKTGLECFINHTHLFDEFKNQATVENRSQFSSNLDVIEPTYDEMHPDFIAASALGIRIAKMWAAKLKLEFPHDRFRVYYTQYDNPIVRFHKVRANEPLWLSDDELQAATDPSFRNAVIYDTDYLDRPIIKAS